MRERDIEKWLRHQIEVMGGQAFKFTSPGNDGVPDRLAVLPGGLIYFIELKTDRGRLTPLQTWQQDRLDALGCQVRTIRGMDEARAFIEEVQDAVPSA
ncbi:MAG: VRR-NUC domain-containing protein [Oscillospiraceae bacterium]|nr:VRR-NUC domain-containing protein [Oscillospiraceae bacterium]